METGLWNHVQSGSVRLVDLGFTVSEDCLNINVVRPSGYNDTLLPVGVYIHGGGYFQGGNSDPRLNFSYIVNNSLAADVPIMAVSFNYRLSGFGFLGGSEILKAEVANIGLRDQRLALQWIHGRLTHLNWNFSRLTDISKKTLLRLEETQHKSPSGVIARKSSHG